MFASFMHPLKTFYEFVTVYYLCSQVNNATFSIIYELHVFPVTYGESIMHYSCKCGWVSGCYHHDHRIKKTRIAT